MPFCKEDNSITNPKPDNVDAVCFIRSDIEKLPTMDIPQGAGHKNDKVISRLIMEYACLILSPNKFFIF